jgi:hypothetical protein
MTVDSTADAAAERSLDTLSVRLRYWRAIWVVFMSEGD